MEKFTKNSIKKIKIEILLYFCVSDNQIALNFGIPRPIDTMVGYCYVLKEIVIFLILFSTNRFTLQIKNPWVGRKSQITNLHSIYVTPTTTIYSLKAVVGNS